MLDSEKQTLLSELKKTEHYKHVSLDHNQWLQLIFGNRLSPVKFYKNIVHCYYLHVAYTLHKYVTDGQSQYKIIRITLLLHKSTSADYGKHRWLMQYVRNTVFSVFHSVTQAYRKA